MSSSEPMDFGVDLGALKSPTYQMGTQHYSQDDGIVNIQITHIETPRPEIRLGCNLDIYELERTRHGCAAAYGVAAVTYHNIFGGQPSGETT